MSFNSQNYWEQRYLTGGNSGAGSYNNLATFKASVINEFIKYNNIVSMIDYGVGDGNQLQLLNVNNVKYTGIDVSPHIISKCKETFHKYTNMTFVLDTEITDLSAELILSCDVIYHLIEDDVYLDYMKTLFSMSNKYVIIYAKNENINLATHVKFRQFTDYIEPNLNNWRLIKYIPNQYPQLILGQNNQNTSPSDFYIYEKI